MSLQDGAQSQPWRTEPEIDEERQKYLAERRSIKPDIEQGVYPFKDIKLSRADVEWLLITHENGRGPVDWSDKSQKRGEGLDVRGADLSQLNLKHLPLGHLRGGLRLEETGTANRSKVFLTATNFTFTEAHQEGASFILAADGVGNNDAFYNLRYLPLFLTRLHQELSLEEPNATLTTLGQYNMAAVFMERANLGGAHLEGANFSGAHLMGANFTGAHLEGANFTGAHLEGANFSGAHLEGTSLMMAHLEEADFTEAHLESVLLNGANLRRAKFTRTDLKRTILTCAHLEVADFSNQDLEGAILPGAYLMEAHLANAFLEGADLSEAHLEKAALSMAHLAGANW